MPSGSRRSPEDAALVSTTITDASLCVECIAKKTGIPTPRVKAALEMIAETVKVAWHESSCDACLTTTKVFRLA